MRVTNIRRFRGLKSLKFPLELSHSWLNYFYSWVMCALKSLKKNIFFLFFRGSRCFHQTFEQNQCQRKGWRHTWVWSQQGQMEVEWQRYWLYLEEGRCQVWFCHAGFDYKCLCIVMIMTLCLWCWSVWHFFITFL